MFTCTETAFAAVQAYLPEAACLRLSISPRGCGAPVVTLDSAIPGPQDKVFSVGERSVCIDGSLCETTKSIELNSINGRLTVTMEEPIRVYGCGLCPASPLQGGTCGIIEGKNF